MMTGKQIIKEIKGVFKPPTRKYYFGKIKHGTPYFHPINFCPTIIKIRKLKEKSAEEREKEVEENPYKKHSTDVNHRFHNIPWVRRSKNWIKKIVGNHYYIEIGWPIMIKTVYWGWKDKYQSPRQEWAPMFHIYFFGLQFCYWYVAPDIGEDRIGDTYWEMLLWWVYYSDKDIKKAEETWGWQDSQTKESTWNKKYLIKNSKL